MGSIWSFSSSTRTVLGSRLGLGLTPFTLLIPSPLRKCRRPGLRSVCDLSVTFEKTKQEAGFVIDVHNQVS